MKYYPSAPQAILLWQNVFIKDIVVCAGWKEHLMLNSCSMGREECLDDLYNGTVEIAHV